MISWSDPSMIPYTRWKRNMKKRKNSMNMKNWSKRKRRLITSSLLIEKLFWYRQFKVWPIRARCSSSLSILPIQNSLRTIKLWMWSLISKSKMKSIGPITRNSRKPIQKFLKSYNITLIQSLKISTKKIPLLIALLRLKPKSKFMNKFSKGRSKRNKVKSKFKRLK